MRKILIAAAAMFVTASVASAATIDKQFKVTSAVGSNADHSLWVSSGTGAYGQDYDFDPYGLFTSYDDGTATLVGKVESQNQAGSGFHLSFTYDSDIPFAHQFKSENGSAAGADIWYRDLNGGTLTGYGDLLGLNLNVSRMPANGPYAVQIGSSNGVQKGPNNKNYNYGMAHWMFITEDVASCGHNYCSNFSGNGKQGDINVDLAPVPLPAAGLMMISGFGAFALTRRRRKS